MKIAILLLCHETPRAVAEALGSPFFRSPDVKVYLHYDGRRSAAHLSELQALLQDGPLVSFVSERVACRWGEYSLVEATHRLMAQALVDPDFQADRLMLVSGSCVPYRPLASLQTFLGAHPRTEFIEAVDAQRERWVQDGLQEERYQYYFPFNYQSQKRWFERATRWQRRLRVHRKPPDGLRFHFGSQWFCLTRSTASRVVQRLDDPALQRFFRHCWIPDEFVIQSLVAESTPAADIAGHSLTYYEFDPQGRPLVIDNGHLPHLLKQPYFWARKISPTATQLKAQLAQQVQTAEPDQDYFAEVGAPSPDYRCHLARAHTVRGARSKVASLDDLWRDVMDRNERAYVVLWSACLPYAHALMTQAQSLWSPDTPVFGEVFRPGHLDIGLGRHEHLGFSSRQAAWRDYAPASILHQLAHAHPTEPAVFMVDPATPNWVRDFLPWDPNAILVNMDPPGLTKVQRAEAGLRHAPRHWRAALVEATYQAAFSNGWLPQEYFLQVAKAQQVACQMVNLAEVTAQTPFAVLRALRSVQTDATARLFFNTDHIAWLHLRQARPQANAASLTPPAPESHVR